MRGGKRFFSKAQTPKLINPLEGWYNGDFLPKAKW